MSQPGGSQYQPYPDPASSLKNVPLPMVNGQPSTPHIQNGVQSPHFNPLGTPSTQSSREPSREPSRDPSPTQYLHNQYRPQLPRPPMPPINGQEAPNRNPTALLSRKGEMQSYSPVATPPPNVNNQPSSGIPRPLDNPAAMPPKFRPPYPISQPSNHALSSQTKFPPSQTNQISSNINTNVGNYPSSSLAFSNPTPTVPNQSFLSTPSHTQSRNSPLASATTDFSDIPLTPDSAIGASTVARTPEMDQNPHGQNSNQIRHTSQNNPNLPLAKTPLTDQNPSNGGLNTTSSLNQVPQSQQLQNVHQSQNVTQHFQSPFPPTSGPPRSQTQNIFGPTTTSTLASQNTANLQPQTKFSSTQNLFGSTQSAQNVLGAAQNITSSTQNLFSSSHQTLYSTQSPVQQNLSGPSSQNLEQAKQQSQYPNQYANQQSVYNSQSNLSGPVPVSQPSPNVYSSQQNLASQRKYPPSAYGAQLPPSAANISGPTLGQTIPGVPPAGPTAPALYQTKPLQPGMPPLPVQQAQSQYGTQQQYPGPMSNVPLDNMAKRYPTSYPDQMNQLNSQMSGLSVAQAGFNKLWGTESIDLLQCRNVLPAEKVEPPRIKLHQEFLDNVNCSPDIFRCTLTKIPESNSLLQKARLPLGVLIHPFKDLNHLPVIQCSTIVRCRACRTYINPFVYFVDSKRWKCNLCYRVNELPDEFQFDPVTKSYGDPSRRPEVKTSTIEFIAPSEYMLRPPQPAVYLFVLDVSRLAVESGYLNVVCNTIADELSRLPGDGRTQVGFLAIDSALHFYSMPDNVSQPHEMVMLDVDDVFLPCPDNLIVNLKEREELVRDLLAQLPTKFHGTHDTNSALGAGLQAAFKLMSPTGGRVTVFQTCLPNVGPGSLQPREDPNIRAGKEVPHLNPATDFYKRLALDCSGQQIAVDLFLLNSQYCDLATLSGMCKFSGGCIYHLPLFRVNKPQHTEVLERMLRRYLTRKVGFEAVMRIRCTRGLSIHTFHGNFFVRSTDLLSLPNVNPDAGFGMQVSIEENLSDVQSICFQAALLYTSSKGERRIRVHTLCLPVSGSLSDILNSADQQCIIGLLSKMAVDRSQQSSLSDARDALINVAIDALSAYKLSQSVGSGSLLAPGNLKLLPLYIIAVLKYIAFRSGTSTRLDDRVFAMCQMKTLPLSQLIQNVYPDLYPIHALDDNNAKDIDGRVCPQPPRLHLTAEKLDSRSAFLLDAGDKIFIYVGKNIHPAFCSTVLGVSSFASIPEEMYELPELETVESERLRNFLFSLNEEKPYYASLQIIRDDSHFRVLFTERLIEDRIESALSYYEFLQHLKTQVK